MIDGGVLEAVFPHLKVVVVDAVGLRGQVVQIGAHVDAAEAGCPGPQPSTDAANAHNADTGSAGP